VGSRSASAFNHFEQLQQIRLKAVEFQVTETFSAYTGLNLETTTEFDANIIYRSRFEFNGSSHSRN